MYVCVCVCVRVCVRVRVCVCVCVCVLGHTDVLLISMHNNVLSQTRCDRVVGYLLTAAMTNCIHDLVVVVVVVGGGVLWIFVVVVVVVLLFKLTCEQCTNTLRVVCDYRHVRRENDHHLQKMH